MKILIIGNENHVQEFKLKFGKHQELTVVEHGFGNEHVVPDNEVVFDFLIDEQPDNFELYQHVEGLPVFVNAPKLSLSELIFINGPASCCLIGFNGLPSFLNRSLLEVTLLNSDDQ